MIIQFDNNRPIYLQLVEHLKLQIISGKFAAGDRLDSVRSLAEKVEVNPNTMQRALAELERQGLVYTQRTNGRFVTEDVDLIQHRKKEYAIDEIKEFMNKLTTLGYKDHEILEIVNDYLKGGSI
ncbi:MAG: GntR family transcriptional regulator [Clostridioides sp.]|jgi:DNA-binding transcriptional regulator YhcF (GntR family)|nr:GntR family transcriptional regulator [Clostridioides sp.]